MRWVAERCGRRGLVLVFGMMVVAGICLGGLSVSDSKSGFTEHLLAGNLGYVFGVAAADLDGDGDLDITSPDIQDKSVSTLYLFRNNGKGKFQKQVIFAGEPGWFERHVIGDIDGDGTPDVAIVNNQKGNVVWFANPGKNGKLPWRRFLITNNFVDFLVHESTSTFAGNRYLCTSTNFCNSDCSLHPRMNCTMIIVYTIFTKLVSKCWRTVRKTGI